MTRRWRAYALATTVLGMLLGATPALAAPRLQEKAPGESNLPFLFAVYTITWIAFFAYAFYMNRRQRELERQVQALRRAQDDGEGSAPPTPDP